MNKEINPGFRRASRKIIDDGPRYGMYVWELPDGEIAGDGDGNIMNVFCMRGDRKAIEALADAAKHYGFPDGKPLWWAGKRRISDEELEEQQTRERLGLTPDPLDFGAYRDELRSRNV